ncbi:hypothetical protein C2S51_003575 [Perilla frutescens var. frutescens]|nr:hypothetical protein C2S51_003575 [Perilla frutescens var. frutescens]
MKETLRGKIEILRSRQRDPSGSIIDSLMFSLGGSMSAGIPTWLKMFINGGIMMFGPYGVETSLHKRKEGARRAGCLRPMSPIVENEGGATAVEQQEAASAGHPVAVGVPPRTKGRPEEGFSARCFVYVLAIEVLVIESLYKKRKERKDGSDEAVQGLEELNPELPFKGPIACMRAKQFQDYFQMLMRRMIEVGEEEIGRSPKWILALSIEDEDQDHTMEDIKRRSAHVHVHEELKCVNPSVCPNRLVSVGIIGDSLLEDQLKEFGLVYVRDSRQLSGCDSHLQHTNHRRLSTPFITIFVRCQASPVQVQVVPFNSICIMKKGSRPESSVTPPVDPQSTIPPLDPSRDPSKAPIESSSDPPPPWDPKYHFEAFSKHFQRQHQALSDKIDDLVHAFECTKTTPTITQSVRGQARHNERQNEPEEEYFDENTDAGYGTPDRGRRQRRGNYNDHYGEDRMLNNIKTSIPEFEGLHDPDTYLDWERKVEKIFDCYDFTEVKKVQLACLEFRGYATTWWEMQQERRRRNRNPPIDTWEEMKGLMRERFIPVHYERELEKKLNKAPVQLKNITKSMNPDISCEVELKDFTSVERMVQYASIVEKQLREGRHRSHHSTATIRPSWNEGTHSTSPSTPSTDSTRPREKFKEERAKVAAADKLTAAADRPMAELSPTAHTFSIVKSTSTQSPSDSMAYGKTSSSAASKDKFHSLFFSVKRVDKAINTAVKDLEELNPELPFKGPIAHMRAKQCQGYFQMLMRRTIEVGEEEIGRSPKWILALSIEDEDQDHTMEDIKRRSVHVHVHEELKTSNSRFYKGNSPSTFEGSSETRYLKINLKNLALCTFDIQGNFRVVIRIYNTQTIDVYGHHSSPSSFVAKPAPSEFKLSRSIQSPFFTYSFTIEHHHLHRP